jgi:hypothetical protein
MEIPEKYFNVLTKQQYCTAPNLKIKSSKPSFM